MLSLIRTVRPRYFAALVIATHPFVIYPQQVGNGQSKGGFELVQSSGAPMIMGLVPDTGPIGTVVVIRGRNFTVKNNVVQFKGEKNFAAGSPVGSKSGTILQFRVTSCPSRQPQCPGFYIPPGVYHVSVINAIGQSNSVSFSLVRPR